MFNSIRDRFKSAPAKRGVKPIKRSTKRGTIFVLYKGKSVPLPDAVKANMKPKEDYRTAYMRAFMRVKAGKKGKEIFAPVQ